MLKDALKIPNEKVFKAGATIQLFVVTNMAVPLTAQKSFDRNAISQRYVEKLGALNQTIGNATGTVQQTFSGDALSRRIDEGIRQSLEQRHPLLEGGQ